MATKFDIPEALDGWLRQSVLAMGVDPFVLSLTSHAYQSSTIRGYVGAIAHIALWMTQQRIALAQFEERLVSQFIDEHVPHSPCDYGEAMPNQKARGAHMTGAAADSVATTLHNSALCIISVEQNRVAVAV